MDGKSLLLLEGDRLRRLGPDGVTVKETLKLPKSYQWIGERPDYFVALSDEAKCLDIVDKKTLAVTRSIQMDYRRRSDLCLHPFKNISYVSVEKPTDGGFLKSILIVNEATGDVQEPDDLLGTWIKISPDGTTLYSGFADVYHKGDRLLVNPGRIDVVPDYGDIAWLIIYDIRGKMPREIALKEGAGGNGQGLALSSDGKRLSYLSYVGYPLYSGNIAAWDPTDLTKRPVSYPTKANKADCKRLAFLPALPIAAAPAEGGAICFDRETGEIQPHRLDLHAPMGAAKVNDLYFSPDGRWLLLDCEEQGARYLRRVKVNLTDAEAAKHPPIATPPAEPVAPDTRVGPTKT
jgi:hypothetical protein